ncbi:MAG: acetate--CoA ligase family protein [Actinomycetota bacterium]
MSRKSGAIAGASGVATDRRAIGGSPRDDALARMLEARSVAVVGASGRAGSFGAQMMSQLVGGGFDGAVYPVNPSYEEVAGMPCFPAVGDVPEEVDLAILGIANARLEEQLAAAARAGARSAVIFASCHEEPRPGMAPLPERLTAIAREAGMVICGGNGMGFLNLDRRLRACGFEEPADLRAGTISFVTHSGSVFSALLHNDRLIRFNLVVSSGLELTTTAADYLRFALDLPTTRIATLFIETVRDPEGFVAALRLAAERDIPVVALKVGREPRAGELVATHSNALAGADGAFEAVFDAYGVIRVRTLDEMADTLELLQGGRRAGPGALAAIHDSGGERAHLVDLAAEERVGFAAISDATRTRLTGVLEEGIVPDNPLDAWGTGADHERIYAESMRALLDDDDTAALAFVVDLTTQDPPGAGYPAVAREVASDTEKPFAVLSNLRAAVDRRDARSVREAGIPVLEGTATGLAAFRNLFALRDLRARPPAKPAEPVPRTVRDEWAARLAAGPLDEVDGLALLRDYGLPVVAAERAGSEAAAVEAAARVGWPVALKTAGTAHKSEVDGVRLGIGDPDALAKAYRDLASRLGPEVTVAGMGPPGVEMALGIVRDPQFGPLVMVAAGGVMVEVLRDRAFSLPPLDEDRARRLVDRLTVSRMLDGIRGAGPADREALHRAVVGLSGMALDLGDLLESVDVNPVIVGPSGAWAVDALVVSRQPD